MNLHTHVSGQVSGQVPTHAGQQVSGSSQLVANSLPSQVRSLGHNAHKMDPELLLKRKGTQDYIIQLLQSRNHSSNSEALLRIPEIARRLEERLYRDTIFQGDDYNSLISTTIDQRLHGITKSLISNQQPHYMSSASASLMIPTPGMISYGNSGHTIYQNNILISTSDGGGSMAQDSVNVGNILRSGSCGKEQIPVIRQASQMIPTPGLNNQQSLSINSESSNGGLFLGMDTPIVSLQQQKHIDGRQNNYLQNSARMESGISSDMKHKPPYTFPNAAIDGVVGSLVGTNMKYTSDLTVSEGHIGPVSYGVALNPLHQQLDKQQHSSLINASISQEMLPLAANGYAMSSSDPSSFGNSQISNPSTGSKQNTDPRMLHQKSMPLNKLASQTKSQMFDHLQSINSLSPHLPQEQISQSEQDMQSFVQFIKPSAQFIHDQRYQRNQQLMSNIDNSRLFSMPFEFSEQLIPANGIESSNETMHPLANEKFHIFERKNHYQRNTSFGNLPIGGQLLGQRLSSQDILTIPSHTCSLKPWEREQHNEDSQNDLTCLFGRSQPDTFSKEHWDSQTQKLSVIEAPSFEQHARKDLYQRMPRKEEAQSVKTIPDACIIIGQDTMLESSNKALYASNREHDYCKQKRWLLLLLHSRKCPSPKGQCEEAKCTLIQQLWIHMDTCNSTNCVFPRCFQSKKLFHHYITCKVVDCPVCIPVQEFVASVKVRNCSFLGASFANKMNGSPKNVVLDSMNNAMRKGGSSLFETPNCHQSSSKRMKVQNLPLTAHNMKAIPSVPAINHFFEPKERQINIYSPDDEDLPCKSEVFEIKMNASLVDECFPVPDSKMNAMSRSAFSAMCATKPCSYKEADNCMKIEMQPVDKERCHVKIERTPEDNITLTVSATTVIKSGKPKINGVSLIELFSIVQVKDHIFSLKQWIGQSKTKVEKHQASERSVSENSCQLCAVEKLTFEPPPIYCTLCGIRIKRNAMYYNVGTGDTRLYFCIPCYNEARYDTIEAEGSTFPKSKLEKKKNDEETEEWWVQCDKCEAWQHQICALFNGKRNDAGQAEYTCPNCYMQEILKGERKPLPQSTVLGAKDLPRTILSDHIEQHLFKRLKQERQARARHLAKTFDEVPGVEELVVRVVSSVDKKLEVKQRFLEIFQEENYPTELSYKSKVILLFQKIEGVEVCLFGMYVQEFGSECHLPNQRRVYLSYLDSVKYFRPEIKTVNGEALRTFVYHEILIGYLDYCKKRGFTSCYIWACPPLKGEDYILYCHPEIQKTPKSDKLREWYLSMLRKASKESIVVGLTNLYDHFFVSTGECKAKVTAARLPYFEGDYWPGAAEDMINQLHQEKENIKLQKKGKTKMTISKRTLRASGHTNLGCNASKDALLMQKLGETISPMKEDFIMVHLQHACVHCCTLMVSGNRWVCHICKHFQICDRCFEAEEKLDERDRHPVNRRERHDLLPIEITNVIADTKDKDEIIESEFFDTRQAFLSLCQGNHYQYDTLRRAKHSSMMVLYHLHNPTAPAFVTTCNVCYHDIETGQGWHCEVCPDFDVCIACYQKEGGINHPHELTNHPLNADRDAQSQEARQKRVMQLRKMLDLLVHASQCRFPHCQYLNCRKVKGLFRHGIQCKTRASKGCLLCKRMWYLLQLHSRACKESKCNVPRCKDLKEHLKRMQQQSESRRRAAVMEMMRQRTAELHEADN